MGEGFRGQLVRRKDAKKSYVTLEKGSSIAVSSGR